MNKSRFLQTTRNLPHAPLRLPSLLLLAVVSLLCGLPHARAAILIWDASGSNPGDPTGGPGTWSTSHANWSTGAIDREWINANNDSATFGGEVGGSVALGEAITVDDITFLTGPSSGYTISGGGFVLTVNGIVTSNRSSTIQANIGGANGFTKAGSQTLTLFSANSYTGNTTIRAGSLQARSTGALPSSTYVIIGVAGSNNNASLDVRASQTVAGISDVVTGSGGSGLGTITQSQTIGTTTLTVNPDGAGINAADSTFAGVIRNGDSSRLLALTKAGSRTLTLTGANTYTGATTVSGGTLIIDGSLASGSAVTVGAAGTLGGSGTIGGSVTVNGTLAAGNSIGTLNTGSLEIGSTGTLDVELGRNGLMPVSDRVNVTGEVTLNGGANLELTLYDGLNTPAAGDIFWLVSNDGGDAVNGIFTELNGVATDLSEGSQFTWNSLEWIITYEADFDTLDFAGGLGNDIALQVVPEPGTGVMVLLGLLIAACQWRRRAFCLEGRAPSVR